VSPVPPSYEDLPYDEFVRAQIAADFIEDDDRRTRALPGLGFLGGGPWFYDGAEPPIARADERNDRVDVTTRGFLGVTVACARCHDHKYDPFTMEDYYGLDKRMKAYLATEGKQLARVLTHQSSRYMVASFKGGGRAGDAGGGGVSGGGAGSGNARAVGEFPGERA